jgi:hypothetical protein
MFSCLTLAALAKRSPLHSVSSSGTDTSAKTSGMYNPDASQTYAIRELEQRDKSSTLVMLNENLSSCILVPFSS